MTLPSSITAAFDYLSSQSVEIPADVWYQTVETGLFRKATKAAGDIGSINAAYHDVISESLTTYLEGGGMAGPKNRMKRAMVEAFGDAFGTGYVDGGAELPFDGEALEWFNAATQQELAYIDSLFVQAKELRKDEEADLFAWATERADSYTRTLADVYKFGKLFASRNKMFTFAGNDGRPDSICQSIRGTCVKLKGKRHKASWWISHGLVPYRGNPNYDCGAWECNHYLVDDQGNKLTT